MRIRSLLGDDALWLVPRLWCYAAGNQPDGDFSGYSSGEIALALGYSKDSQAMLEALQQAGFMDGMALHDWSEHNEYHSVFAERAKKAATARWDKVREKKDKKKGKDKRQALLDDTASNASSMKRPEKAEFSEYITTDLGMTPNDADHVWNVYEENGWTRGQAGGKRTPLSNWKLALNTWKTGGYFPSQKNGTGRSVAPKRRDANI